MRAGVSKARTAMLTLHQLGITLIVGSREVIRCSGRDLSLGQTSNVRSPRGKGVIRCLSKFVKHFSTNSLFRFT